MPIDQTSHFRLRPDDHMGNIMRDLRTPPSETFTKVTFPEGFTYEQMALRLNEKVPRLDIEGFTVAASDGDIRSEWLPSGIDSLVGLFRIHTFGVSAGLGRERRFFTTGRKQD